jgi:hypothetical protein
VTVAVAAQSKPSSRNGPKDNIGDLEIPGCAIAHLRSGANAPSRNDELTPRSPSNSPRAMRQSKRPPSPTPPVRNQKALHFDVFTRQPNSANSSTKTSIVCTRYLRPIVIREVRSDCAHRPKKERPPHPLGMAQQYNFVLKFDRIGLANFVTSFSCREPRGNFMFAKYSNNSLKFFCGVFVLCMSVLMVQIIQTRILSVVSLY